MLDLLLGHFDAENSFFKNSFLHASPDGCYPKVYKQ